MENPELVQLIRGEIERDGPISFARFMELVLYHPRHGYYASGRAAIGRRGDFFTNVSVGPLFGKLLAAQFAEIWQKLGEPRGFSIIEQGAHDGIFAADVLNALRQSGGQCFAATSYMIAEPFLAWRKRQQNSLHEFTEKVSWVESIDQVASFVGVHFSNELFDSLPVHLIVSGSAPDSREIANGATDWKEKFVTVSGGDFAFATAKLSHELRVDRLGFFPAAFETEVSLAAPKLMGDIASKLSRGVILTIDYGYVRPEFHSPDRRQGSLQIRAKQKKLSSCFEQIGVADISAHVEWSSLVEAALSCGAKPVGFTDQHHFFTGILSKCFPNAEFSFSGKRALQTLLHPEMLGRNFQVLALGKGFSENLAGFEFARDGVEELRI